MTLNRRTLLGFIPAAMLAPEGVVYRISGYTESGAWAEEVTDPDGLARARAGEPVGAVHTWVAVERLAPGEWVALD